MPGLVLHSLKCDLTREGSWWLKDTDGMYKCKLERTREVLPTWCVGPISGTRVKWPSSFFNCLQWWGTQHFQTGPVLSLDVTDYSLETKAVHPCGVPSEAQETSPGFIHSLIHSFIFAKHLKLPVVQSLSCIWLLQILLTPGTVLNPRDALEEKANSGSVLLEFTVLPYLTIPLWGWQGRD